MRGRFAHEATGLSRLCLAGGVALNCVSNSHLLEEGPFDDIWVQPAAGDAGGALGAAMLVWHQLLGHSRFPLASDSQSGSLLGPRCEDEEVQHRLAAQGAKLSRMSGPAELCEVTASLLSQGMVVGWFQGRMEFGPRALGSRSILADARDVRMQSALNLKIKFRESFRPFAPAVLSEHASEWFDMGKANQSPYMLFVMPVRDHHRLLDEENTVTGLEKLRLRRSDIPAVTHVDYSARVQTVDKRHGLFYDLMQRFYEQTGCPVLINTSFNVRGEPIVCTPEDAYRCFMATGIDALVIGNCLLLKEEQPNFSPVEITRHLKQFALD